MKIDLKKFGIILSSRPAGKDAFAGFLSELEKLGSDEIIEVDFSGVQSFSPSWGDEFLSPLIERYAERLILKNTSNLSVSMTLELLEEINGYKFIIDQLQ